MPNRIITDPTGGEVVNFSNDEPFRGVATPYLLNVLNDRQLEGLFDNAEHYLPLTQGQAAQIALFWY